MEGRKAAIFALLAIFWLAMAAVVRVSSAIGVWWLSSVHGWTGEHDHQQDVLKI
jgi:hypothetical protein